MAITEEQVREFAGQWFTTVFSRQGPEAQGRFFVDEDPRVFIGNGDTYNLTEHDALHDAWSYESHVMGPIELTHIKDDPERVRVSATVYWEAMPKDGDELVRTVAGEDWILENTPEGLKFVLYMATFFHALPNSAESGVR